MWRGTNGKGERHNPLSGEGLEGDNQTPHQKKRYTYALGVGTILRLAGVLISDRTINGAINVLSLFDLVQHRFDQVVGNPDQVVQRA